MKDIITTVKPPVNAGGFVVQKDRRIQMFGNDKIIKVELDNFMLYDRLNLLSSEYAISTDRLVNIAIKRLLDDVTFVQGLRKGIISSTHHQKE